MKKILLFQIYLVTSQNFHAEFYNLMCNMFFPIPFFGDNPSPAQITSLLFLSVFSELLTLLPCRAASFQLLLSICPSKKARGLSTSLSTLSCECLAMDKGNRK